MPKDRSSRSVSYERHSRGSPYPSSSSHGRRSSCRPSEEPSGSASAAAAAKSSQEWEDVRCPVCMEHPHNAVLLMCSSHDKGCRPFMCDTSYRHSNCLDQYRKAFKESASAECSECQQPAKLSCPLCRGPVSHWTKDEDAREYMNSKVRTCTMESCEFRGVYSELRKHAREAHPSVRPMEVDPERQRDWRRMEQQRDLGDLFSMLHSGINGSEDGLGIGEEEEEFNERVYRGPSITMVFIVRSGRSVLRYTSSSFSRGASSSRRGRAILLFGESLGEPAPAGGPSTGGDASSLDNDEGRNLGASEEASAGSHHDRGGEAEGGGSS